MRVVTSILAVVLDSNHVSDLARAPRSAGPAEVIRRLHIGQAHLAISMMQIVELANPAFRDVLEVKVRLADERAGGIDGVDGEGALVQIGIGISIAEVPQDLVDHRRLGDAGDDAHGAVARRAREGVDLEDLLQKRRPPAGGLGRRQAWRAADGGGRTSCGRLGLTPHAARAIGVPAMVARGHVPFSSFVRPSERHALTSASLTSLVGRRKVLDAFTEWLCSESLACYNEGVAGRD